MKSLSFRLLVSAPQVSQASLASWALTLRAVQSHLTVPATSQASSWVRSTRSLRPAAKQTAATLYSWMAPPTSSFPSLQFWAPPCSPVSGASPSTEHWNLTHLQCHYSCNDYTTVTNKWCLRFENIWRIQYLMQLCHCVKMVIR